MIATSGSSSASSAPLRLPLNPSASTPTAAAAAKHSAQQTGTSRQTANARAHPRGSHAQAGTAHSPPAAGIATNPSTAEMLSPSFSDSKAKNPKRPSTATTTMKNSPTALAP